MEIGRLRWRLIITPYSRDREQHELEESYVRFGELRGLTALERQAGDAKQGAGAAMVRFRRDSVTGLLANRWRISDRYNRDWVVLSCRDPDGRDREIVAQVTLDYGGV